MAFGIDITLMSMCYIAVAIVIGALLLGLISLQLFIYFTTGVCKSKRKMNGKTVLITGCTSGIGKETARDLAKREARIIMACRNVDAATKLKGILIK